MSSRLPNAYSLSHLENHVLMRDLVALVVRDRDTTAAMLAHVAEVDARRLYAPAGYPSMFAYCVGELRMSEDAAFKRIRAARMARQFPAIFAAVVEGRLTLSAVVLLAPHLTPANADELLTAATHKSKFQIETLLAERFPQLDLPTLVQPIGPAISVNERAPGPVGVTNSEQATTQVGALASQLVPGPVEPPAPRTTATQLAPRRFWLQVTVGQETYDKLRRAQELLGHSIVPGDLAEVFDRALDALIVKLEKRKFATTEHPRHSKVAKGRHVPADVRRAVRERDGDRCTFTSEAGKRCEERTGLEYDHIVPVARGGPSTVENVRLCCRAHNQHSADREFGKGFMDAKRTRWGAKKPKAPDGEAAHAHAPIARPTEQAPPLDARADEDPCTDVKPWLRRQGFSDDQVRAAAAKCETIPDAPIHERVRYAMALLVPERGQPPVPAGKRSG